MDETQTKEELAHAAALVEDVIRRMGLEPDKVRIAVPEPSRASGR